MARPRTAVVHLVRQANGLAPFAAFMDSYDRMPAGLEHELVLLFKGFAERGALAPYLERAAGASPAQVELPDDGLDLGAYVAAAKVLEHERMCLLNSFSEILVPDWLAMLDVALQQRSVGAAGATGSWASHLSYNLFALGLPGAYSGVFASRRAARQAMHEISETPVPGAISNWLFTLRQMARSARASARFPAAHLRTNAFLISRARLLALGSAPANTKWDTYRLESGPRSLTARLSAAGAPPVVVDAHGVARQREDWHRGDVYFQATQEDLLVADNQTRSYASATAEQRAVLSAFAWGDNARPG